MTLTTIPGQNGPINAYVAKGTKQLGILLVPDVFGYTYEGMQEIADLIATEGYTTIIPDYFRGDPWKSGMSWNDFPAWLKKHPQERVSADSKAAIAWLKKSHKKVGAVGFCWGGLQVFHLAQTGLLSVAVDFYGSRMNPEEGKNMKCPFLGMFGAQDEGIPLVQIETLRKTLPKSGQPHKILVYPNSGHAFVQKREHHNPEMAAKALDEMKTWFKNCD